jgi:hypothetical protein
VHARLCRPERAGDLLRARIALLAANRRDLMSRKTHLLASVLGMLGLCALALGCGSGEEPSTGAPAASKAPPAATAQEMSADGQRCLDLVKSKQYAEAIDPCERALRQAANVDVQRAYDQAKAELEQAATSAAGEAASGALRDLGGE